MSSPETKMTKKHSLQPSPLLSLMPGSTPNPSLPDDLLLSCFARVSKLYYPTLSLASNSFRSLLCLPELYETRSRLNRTERCLYVCLQLPAEPNPSWFTLCRKPNRALTSNTTKKSSGYVLAPIQIPDSPQANSERVAAVIGSDIYAIGGPINESPFSSVSILDCKSHTWREAPSMHVDRDNPSVNVFNGKIYVAGGYDDGNSPNWSEVFDPKTKTWEVMSCSPEYRNRSIVIDGEIVKLGQKGAAYVAKDDRWEAIGGISYIDLKPGWGSCCVIDNVLYCCRLPKVIKWYDSEVREWKIVKGLVGLPRFPHFDCVRLADYGGRMVVLWDDYLTSRGYSEKAIWCAEISFERRRVDEVEDEIWGNVEWFDCVLTVCSLYKFLKVVTVTL